MKITNEELKQIIKEELEKVLSAEDQEVIDSINEFLNSGQLSKVIYAINLAGTMDYPIESIDIHGLIKNIPNWGDDMYGAAIEISDAMLENYEEYYNQFVDDGMRSQRGFRKDPNEVTENDKIKLFLKFFLHLNDEAQVLPLSGAKEELEEKKKRKKAGTESSKESSLRDWFGRKGAKGKKKGWVDCNAPDGKGGYKSCGRSDGEKRKKYPACRPTPGACKERGKGKSWGKKAKKRGKRK